jgi:hypothetical protein
MRAIVAIAICACLLLAGSAEAVTLVLRPDGTGDVPTFQAGVDSLVAHRSDPPPDDTLWVEPGRYDETVHIAYLHHSMHFTIHCPGGPGVTNLRGLRTSYDFQASKHVVRVEGLRIENNVRMTSGSWGFDWYGCRFDEGFSVLGPGDCLPPNFFDCEFRGPVVLRGYNELFSGGGFDHCRFIQAPLQIRGGSCGDLLVSDCVFEGADTLVVAKASGDMHDAIGFQRCVFRTAEVGLVSDDGGNGYWRVRDCLFEDIEGAAILRLPVNGCGSCDPWFPPPVLIVTGSRFERCGQAVSLHPLKLARLSMVADTIRTVRETAIDASRVEGAGLDGVTIEDVGGAGVVLRPATRGPQYGGYGLGVRNSSVKRCASTGVAIGASDDGSDGYAHVKTCVVSDNGGDGVRVEARQIEVEGNIVSGNRGAGLVATYGRPTTEHSEISGNTCVANGGAGLLVQSVCYDSSLVLTNNLTVGNSGDGLVLQAPPRAQALHNDSWLNGGSPYVGAAPADQNLTVDPLFCDPQAGDYHVQASSPCAPTGPYGQIGALGVGCVGGAPVAVGDPSVKEDSRTLAIRGANPSLRGCISLQLATSDEAELGVFDLAGRRVAVQRLIPARSGVSEVILPAALPNGVYLVRLAQGPRVMTRRITLLR